MVPLTFGRGPGALRTILCLGAHCDDIEIGCGGTILRLAEEHPAAHFHWVVFSSNPRRAAETRAASERLLARAGSKTVIINDFRNGYFPYIGAQIKDYFEKLKAGVSPDLILTHTRDDLHQDHRVLCDLTWNTFRHHMILEYEIPKYDGDLGAPNFFVPLPAHCRQGKLDALMTCFASEHGKQWFTPETFNALMRLRGVECNSPSGYAEAFYCRKAVV
jgi:LmbE family N-acetylglucosaminyl deacetylase